MQKIKVKRKMKKYKEIRLQVEEDVLLALGDFLYLRKITDNTIGPDYEFLALLLTSIQKGEKEILIETKRKPKEKKRKK